MGKCQWEGCETKVLKMDRHVDDSEYCFQHHRKAFEKNEEGKRRIRTLKAFVTADKKRIAKAEKEIKDAPNVMAKRIKLFKTTIKKAEKHIIASEKEIKKVAKVVAVLGKNLKRFA